jgi:hypothetical protein
MKILLLFLLSFFLLQLHAQQPVTPKKAANNNYFFQFADVYFEVNPNHGARIESFKQNGTEFLYVEHKAGVEDMYGSTAWLSPQSIWNWPPQTQIDINAYSGGISGNKVILTSSQATAGTIKFLMRKTFSADLSDSSVSITYSIINKSTSAKSFAAWEIMRVPTGGLTFYPVNGAVTGNLASVFTIQDGIAWWDYDSTITTSLKSFADGNGGWLAHLDNNRIIQIKKFTDTPSNFPSNSEKEIEIYAEGNMYYNEIEKHTDYKLIPVNDSAVLTMTWYLRKLPENIPASLGNADLTAYVNNIINPPATGININNPISDSYRIYPNPSSGEIQISGINSGENIRFQLMNILGETLANRTVSSGEKIDLSSFKNGIYLYKIQSATAISTGKLLMKK